ncbi:MAG TPA: hypothetical protein PKD54_14285, partial [Pirellulaceae bacterium]|nr:hypothetical protein [Pirellulaceae bacterium]
GQENRWPLLSFSKMKMHDHQKCTSANRMYRAETLMPTLVIIDEWLPEGILWAFRIGTKPTSRAFNFDTRVQF